MRSRTRIRSLGAFTALLVISSCGGLVAQPSGDVVTPPDDDANATSPGIEASTRLDATLEAALDARPEAGDAATDVVDSGPPLPPAPPLGPDTTIKALTAGHNHTCILWTDGVAQCWGDNTYGQLGLGDTKSRGGALTVYGTKLPAVPVPPGGKVQSIRAAGNRTCISVLVNDTTGLLQCFGQNTSGELGLDSKTPVLAPGPNSLAGGWFMGANHSCRGVPGSTWAYGDFMKIQCWGNDAFGQLGAGDTVNRGDDPGEMATLPLALQYTFPPSPTGVVGGSVTFASPNASHTCVAWRDNVAPQPYASDPNWIPRVACWGKNDKGQLGLGDTINRGDKPGQALVPADLGMTWQASTGLRLTFVAAGGSHSCAVQRNYGPVLFAQRVKCWGSNAHGQLGVGDTNDRGDQPGEMGDALPGAIGVPYYASGGRGGVDDTPYLALGGSHSCALEYANNNGSGVQCWGANAYGQLGLGDSRDRGTLPTDLPLPPIDVGTGKQAAWPNTPDFIASGQDHVCVVIQDSCAQTANSCVNFPRKVKCWGRNDKGQLGLGDTNNRGDQPGEMGDALPTLDLR